MAAPASKYKARKAERLAGRPMKMRETMPWWYEMATRDFSLREKEQAEAARRGPLSQDAMRPWGNAFRRRDEEESSN